MDYLNRSRLVLATVMMGGCLVWFVGGASKQTTTPHVTESHTATDARSSE
jgi:hypothetical protein